MRRTLIYGVGINDADYPVDIRIDMPKINGKRVRKTIWICPFYWCWRAMIQRCYSEKSLKKGPSYKGCYVVDEWLRFSKFKAWMETQDWEGKQLDKDLLVRGNKTYSPETCCFLSPSVNSFLVESTAARGDWPIGVSWNKKGNCFEAYCGNFLLNKRVYLGSFKNPLEAHAAWLEYKLKVARDVAALEKDLKISQAIISRYEHYKET